MTQMKLTEFLRGLLNSGRFLLGTEGEGWPILMRRTASGRFTPLDWSWDHKKGLEARIRMFKCLRLVKRFDLAWTLFYGTPPADPLFPKDGSWRNPDPRNLVNLKGFREGYHWERPTVMEMTRKMSPKDWVDLAIIRDRYFPAPIPPEVAQHYDCNLNYLKRKLKGIPVQPLAAEQERLVYVPDCRPNKHRNSFTVTPDKTLPKGF